MNLTNTFKKLSRFGVLPRNSLKNELKIVNCLMRAGMVRKVYKKGHVFYELTEKALGPLNDVRLALLAEARLRNALAGKRQWVYKAILEDIRSLDTSNREAQNFRFLGDWRLGMPPVASQLLLSQFRMYQKMGL